MIVVDGFTKMGDFIGVATNGTTKDVADMFLEEVWKLHRLPSEIFSDMDPMFSADFWQSLGKELGMKR